MCSYEFEIKWDGRTENKIIDNRINMATLTVNNHTFLANS
jgi:hypothetical protein